MTFHSLRPRGMSPAGERLWRFGDDTGDAYGRRSCAGDPPVPGDLWILAGVDFDEVDAMAVIVTAVDEGSQRVDCVVVTPDLDVDESSTLDAAVIRLPGSVLGVPMLVWPGFGAVVSYASLRRRLGDGLDAMTLAKMKARSASVASRDGSVAQRDHRTSHPVLREAISRTTHVA